MIVWPAKDPGEVLDYSWSVPLDEGDAITSYSANVTGAQRDSATTAGSKVTVWISSGTDGENATVAMTATTEDGRLFRETAILPIFDRASALLADFRLRYPAFDQVPDGTVGYWLNDAGAHDHWPALQRDTARLTLTAHRLEAGGFRKKLIPAGVTSFKSGTFSAQVDPAASRRVGFDATIYGREYRDLARQFAGPRLAWAPGYV